MPDREAGGVQMTVCTTVGCDEPAVRRLRYPFAMIAGEFEGDYCDAHADQILRDHWTWPGAREVQSREVVDA